MQIFRLICGRCGRDSQISALALNSGAAEKALADGSRSAESQLVQSQMERVLKQHCRDRGLPANLLLPRFRSKSSRKNENEELSIAIHCSYHGLVC